MATCMSDRKYIVSRTDEAFVVVETAEQAVDRLAALHEKSTAALSQALKRYLKDRTEPNAEERALFRYPELRLTYSIMVRCRPPPAPTPRFSCRAPTASR